MLQVVRNWEGTDEAHTAVRADPSVLATRDKSVTEKTPAEFYAWLNPLIALRVVQQGPEHASSAS